VPLQRDTVESGSSSEGASAAPAIWKAMKAVVTCGVYLSDAPRGGHKELLGDVHCMYAHLTENL